jgi:hypothetical protein
MIRVRADIPRFRASLKRAMKATKKTSAEVLNRFARNVVYRAAQFTPATTASNIDQELRANQLLAKLASANLRKKQGRYTRDEHRAEMEAIRRKRRRGAKALRSGWANAIRDLGGSFRGITRHGSSASKGFGKKASAFNLVARVRNSIVTTNAFGQQRDASQIQVLVTAFDRAVEFVTADSEVYAQKKAAQTMREHSD